MNEKKTIFLKYSLLEEIETTKKGNVDSDQILTLINNKKYKLEEAIIFKEKLEGTPKKNLVNQIITIKDIEKLGYDLYMDTVIVGDSAYRVEEGFKGTLIAPPITIKVDQDSIRIVESDIKVEKKEPTINANEFQKNEKTNEQLLADFMLGM